MDPRGLGSGRSGPTWPRMTDSGFIPADSSLGAPTVLSSGNPGGAFVSGTLVAVMGAWWQLGFEGWVGVWGPGVDHSLVRFGLPGLARF